MDTPQAVKDCNNCKNHVQGRTLDDCPQVCWFCIKDRELTNWEPIQMKPLEYAKLHGATEEETPKHHEWGQLSALDKQEGGDHYKKLKIQPMEYSMANELDACQHTVIKYVTRFRDKGTPQMDLDKAIHAIELLKQFEGLS